MFFFEQPILRQLTNSNGLYLRYIDDIFLMINWPQRHLFKQIERWNQFDENIELNAQIGRSINFLDLHIENDQGSLLTKVYHKPSYEPYYLPFNSIHPMHMKKNIPFAMFLRAIRYCSTFQFFIEERESFRMALLLNRYPNIIIQEQFNKVLQQFKVKKLISSENYDETRYLTLLTSNSERLSIDYEQNLFIHFTYCAGMRVFPVRFIALWKKYFSNSPVSDITPVLGTRNVDNLQLRLVHTKSNRS